MPQKLQDLDMDALKNLFHSFADTGVDPEFRKPLKTTLSVGSILAVEDSANVGFYTVTEVSSSRFSAQRVSKKIVWSTEHYDEVKPVIGLPIADPIQGEVDRYGRLSVDRKKAEFYYPAKRYLQFWRSC